MKQSNFTKLSTLLLAIVLTISANQLFAQTTNGIFFQAVARDNFSNPAKDRKIFVQTSIIQTTVTGTKVLTEEHQANTDATGVFSVSIGNGTRVGGTAANLNGIDWSKGPFFLNLKVSITPIGSSASWDYTKEWVDMGTTNFGAVPFSFFAASVAGFDTKINVSDSAKMLLPYAKTTAVTSLSTNVDTKLSTKLNVADSAKYVTPTQLAAKTFDTTSLSNRINLKAVATEVATSLNNKLNIADSTNGYVTPTQLAAKTFDQTPITNAIASKLNIADSATKYVTPAQLASYNFSTGAVTIDTSNLSNRINLKADASAVTTSLNLKANASDVTSALNLKANVADLTAGLALKVNASQLGIANGIATLNSSGIIPSSQLPPVTLSSTSVVGSDADMMALSSATVGSIAIRTDLNKNYVLSATPASTLSNWVELLTPAAPVQTVNGYTGAVNIAKSDIGLGNVDNTTDASKPVSTATQSALDLKANSADINTALNLKANLASPTFTGIVSTSAINTGDLSSTSVTAPTYASTPKTLSYTGSTINWNPAQGLNAAITLTQNSALSFTSSPPVGSYGTVVLTQDATGGRTITLPSLSGITNKVLGSTSTTTVALSAAANAKDILNFYYDGNNCYWNIGQGYGTAATAASTNLATSVSGTLAVANGGTGATTLTGLVKGTGTTAFTAAVAGTDYLAPNGSAANLTNFPTFNQNTTGNAATVTTNANLNGDVTSVGNTATVVKINGTSLASLSTGILKNTTSTGVPTIAVAGTDYQAPINLTTTGTGAATLSGTTLNIPAVSSTVNASTISGTVGIANGGTGLSTIPANGQIDIGNGTGFTRATLTAGTAITITNTAGTITIAAAVRPTTDQFTATSAHAVSSATFTLSQTPLNTKVWMFINGIRTNNSAYSISGTTVTYTAASNNNYTIVVGDRIQFDYAY